MNEQRVAAAALSSGDANRHRRERGFLPVDVFTLARVLARMLFTPYAAYAGLHTSLMLQEKSAYGFFVDRGRTVVSD